MQIATYLAKHLCNNNSNQIFPVVVVLRSLSNLSLCNGQTFSIYRSAFLTLLLHGQKVLTQAQNNPLDFSCGMKSSMLKCSIFWLCLFRIESDRKNLEFLKRKYLRVKEKRERVMVKFRNFPEMKLWTGYKPLLHYTSNPFPGLWQKVFTFVDEQ